MTFDAENKLTAAGSLMTAGYTIEGLRAWKQNTSSGVRTYFLYDGTTPVVELTSSGAISATNTFSPLGLVSRNVAGSGSIFYTFDERGNVSQRLSSSGVILSTDLYSAFGTLLAGGGDVFGFGAKSGYYTDVETGLVLCTYRYYVPSAGRWLTRDRIGYAGGINLYSYCGNSAINRIDPRGEAGIPTGEAITGIIEAACGLLQAWLSNHLDACTADVMDVICDGLSLILAALGCMTLGATPAPWMIAVCALEVAIAAWQLYEKARAMSKDCACPVPSRPTRDPDEGWWWWV